MNNKLFYICQTLLEDNRLCSDRFQERIISPLNLLLSKVTTLNVCLHPRSQKSNYYSLLLSKKIIFDNFIQDYCGKNHIFIGHYSTIIFQLIAKSERVILIDLEWDQLPVDIYKSCSKVIKWYDFKNYLQNFELNSISCSNPNKEFLRIFESSSSKKDEKTLKRLIS